MECPGQIRAGAERTTSTSAAVTVTHPDSEQVGHLLPELFQKGMIEKNKAGLCLVNAEIRTTLSGSSGLQTLSGAEKVPVRVHGDQQGGSEARSISGSGATRAAQVLDPSRCFSLSQRL